MSTILILYSTTDGHTLQICQKILSVAKQNDHEVQLLSIDDASQVDAETFDKIVIGASIRYGRHQKSVLEFIRQHEQILEQRPSAFFSVNAVARKPEKSHPDTNPYLQKFLRQITWQPDELAVFAGEIDYRKYRLLDRLMIRLIMYMTHGPTEPDSVTDFTNWKKVDHFANTICVM